MKATLMAMFVFVVIPLMIVFHLQDKDDEGTKTDWENESGDGGAPSPE